MDDEDQAVTCCCISLVHDSPFAFEALSEALKGGEEEGRERAGSLQVLAV